VRLLGCVEKTTQEIALLTDTTPRVEVEEGEIERCDIHYEASLAVEQSGGTKRTKSYLVLALRTGPGL